MMNIIDTDGANSIMKLAIVGGGNLGTLMAAEFAAKGHEVSVFTKMAAAWKRSIEIYDRQDEFISVGDIASTTDSLSEAVTGASIIFVTLPAFTFPDLAEKLAGVVKKGQAVCIIPGTGGAEFAFAPLIEKGCILLGFQRVHSIARIKDHGRSVYALGKKERLFIGSIPSVKAEDYAPIMEALFDIPTTAVPNYLNVTLTPSNPILHTARLCAMFRDTEKDTAYPKNPLFYEEWDDASSELLLKCDTELHKMVRAIPLDLRYVESLAEIYEGETPPEVTKTIRETEYFKGLGSPMKRDGDDWYIDWESRYFTADFPYGLKILIDIAGLFDVPVPDLTETWEWYLGYAPDTPRFEMKLDREELLELYRI